jgi:hypothetical protein
VALCAAAAVPAEPQAAYRRPDGVPVAAGRSVTVSGLVLVIGVYVAGRSQWRGAARPTEPSAVRHAVFVAAS